MSDTVLLVCLVVFAVVCVVGGWWMDKRRYEKEKGTNGD